MKWTFAYSGDDLERVEVYRAEFSNDLPYEVATYEGVPATETTGCPTSFPIPLDPRPLPQ